MAYPTHSSRYDNAHNVGNTSGFAAYDAYAQSQNMTGQNYGNNPAEVERHEPGVSSATSSLEKVAHQLTEYSVLLEEFLGLSVPGPECEDPHTALPSLVVRIQNIGNDVDSANYRLNKVLKHLRS